MEKISRTDRVRNEEVLKTIKGDRIFSSDRKEG